VTVGILQNSPVQAECIRNPLTGKKVCDIEDLDPTPGIPGSRDIAERVWGNAGSSAYQAAASAMRGRNGRSQGLDEVQKKYLRPHFGDLVDRVAIIYGARMLDQWSAFGKEINLSGVDTAAQTYCNRIYVRDSYKPNDFQQLVTLSHEMIHSKQCEELGGEGEFGFHYFREFKRAGENYENNKLEQEAYSFENQFASSLSNQPQPNKTTVMNRPFGSNVSFRTAAKGLYVVAENGGSGIICANRSAVGPWETFRLIDLNGGSLTSGDVVNLASDQGTYVTAEDGGGGTLSVNRPNAGPWEEITVLKVNGNGAINSGDVVVLRTKNGQFIVAEDGGGGRVNANRTAIGSWEQFIIEFR